MDTRQIPTDQNSMENEVSTQQDGTNNNKLFVIVLISVLLTAVLAGSVAYLWQKSANEKVVNTLEREITSLEEQISALKDTTVTPQPTSLPVITQMPADEIRVYTDPNGRYRFMYPPSWKILDKVPEKFWAKPSYVEGGSLEEWLSGKMIGETCRGPILQNISDTNQLIALEVVDAKGDGGFCWSVGYFMNGNKWKVSERYVFPIGSNNIYEPEWKGDYFKMEKAAESNELIAFVSLANYETFQLKGEDTLQSIISSFQFTD